MTQSQLAYLGFQLYKPSLLLRKLVQNYWVIQSHDTESYREEFLHPNGGLGIVFNFGDDFMLDGELVRADNFLDGANSYSRRLNFTNRVNAIGIRFYPGGAYPFFHLPIFEIVDNPYSLTELDVPYVDVIRNQLYHAVSVHQQVTILDQWLLQRLNDNRLDIQLVSGAVHLIRQSQGQTFIHDLSDTIGISSRQLQRQFKEQVGISPKLHARLLRVDYARGVIKQMEQATFADVAYQAGYYDQSHFIREFKSVVGMTPGDYQKRHQQRYLHED